MNLLNFQTNKEDKLTKNLIISNQLSLPLDAVTQVFAFLGRRGAGKSYGSTKLAELMLEAKAQIVALDPVGVWWGLRLAKDGKSPGFPIPVFGGLHGDVPIDSRAGALIADLIVDREYSAVIDISQMITSEQTRFAYDFATQLFQRKKSKVSALHVFLEESQEFAPQNIIKGDSFSAKMLGAFERLVKLGRNFGIGVSLIGQRPQEINKKVLNQTECLLAFQTNGVLERKAIESWINDKGLKEEIFDLLPHLEEGAPHVWSPQWLKFSSTIKIAEKKSYDASSTPKVGAKPIEVKELSPVDIEQINDAMQSIVEKAKADDPKVLRQKIAQLERELKSKPVSDFSQADLQREKRLKEETETSFRKLFDQHELLKVQYTGLTIKLNQINQLSIVGDVEIEEIKPLPKAQEAKRALPMSTPPEKRQPVKATSSNDSSVSKPQQSILDAVAWFESVGIDSPSRSNVAAIAGVSPRSSGYRANVSTLSGLGMVRYPQGDCLSLTEMGSAAANRSDAPVSLNELHQAWLSSKALSQPQKNILRILMNIYPKAISREDLASEAGVSFLSSGYRANISTLSGLQLVTYPSSNMVQASGALLFPVGLSR